jgi:hypothetical protein
VCTVPTAGRWPANGDSGENLLDEYSIVRRVAASGDHIGAIQGTPNLAPPCGLRENRDPIAQGG